MLHHSMAKGLTCWILMAGLVSLAAAQVRLKGEITGFILDNGGEPLPGASVLLTGEKLLRNSQEAVANDKGFFRFLNLNPGTYLVEVSLSGFHTLKIPNVRVSVGQSEPIRAVLSATALQTEIVVTGDAPLIDTKSAQISTNFTGDLVAKLPTTRDMLDFLDLTPAVNDKGAYGAGARYDALYGRGSSTSTVRLNGVDVSDVEVGNTWVNPNYDTLEEVQVVGIGAAAEYGNFTGATINVVTKGGTNTLHGSLSSYYDNRSLWADNSGGILDLKPKDVKTDMEITATLGGPLIKERVFFFLAAGYNANQSKKYGDPAYADLKQPHAYLKLDWLASPYDSLSFMANMDPLKHSDLGLTPGSAPETAYTNRLSLWTLSAGWQHAFGASSLLEAKYAGYLQRLQISPDAPDTPALFDYTINRNFGSSGARQDALTDRHEVDISLSHYADDFLAASHEFKFGVQFSRSSHETSQDTTGGVIMEAYSLGPYDVVMGLEGYNFDRKATVTQLGGFVQDTIQINRRLVVDLGLRIDAPRLTARGFEGVVTRFMNVSPRFGLSYDITGDAKNVMRLHFGRYYDKMMTYGLSLGYPMGADSDFFNYYLLILAPGQLAAYRDDPARLAADIIRPQNLYLSIPVTEPIPVEKNMHSAYTDVINVGFQKEIFKNFALSVDYIYKRDAGMLQINSRTPHSYQEVTYTDPYLGRTITLWDQTDRTPDEYYYTNSTWGKRRHHFFQVELRKRLVGNWSMLASYVYQDSRGNVDNDDAAALGIGRWGQDSDPLYTRNPLLWGHLSYERPHQFKLLGTVILPWNITVCADVRLLSGNPWQAEIPMWMTGIYRSQYDQVLLEKRGSRRHPMSTCFNAHLSKAFRIKESRFELILDVLNVLNTGDASWFYIEPYSVYPLSGEAAFGQPQELQDPRRARIGIRWTF